ncbi:clavesin-2-like [Musca vetustissima]|uniref:clavesin-2-like n=1 Tax=Musca vetustissima TaxID=27455 RepID=UPI002AB6C66E|nr:clavesin-2-like [Musca vetustissima]
MSQLKPLPEDLQKISIEELGEVPSRIPADLEALNTWIKLQPHLRARMDDQFLIQFLRGCKYSLERTKEKVDLYFSLKTKYPNMFASSDVDDPKFREMHNLGCYVLLPKPLNGNGCRICVGRFSYSPDKFNIEDIYPPTSAMFEITFVNDPYAAIQGFVFIFDFGECTASHLLQFTPTLCKKIVSFLEKSMPCRIRAAYFIKVPTAAQQILRVIFTLCSEKLRQRLFVLGNNINDLTKHIPLEYLPKDYGGNNGSFSELTKEYNKTFDLYREYFKENAKYGTDESLRPGKPIDLDGPFGLGGSFRKLAVD